MTNDDAEKMYRATFGIIAMTPKQKQTIARDIADAIVKDIAGRQHLRMGWANMFATEKCAAMAQWRRIIRDIITGEHK